MPRRLRYATRLVNESRTSACLSAIRVQIGDDEMAGTEMSSPRRTGDNGTVTEAVGQVRLGQTTQLLH